MVTVSVQGILIGVLLIALIVLVVYLIILVSNLTDTVKKTNAIIDGSTEAAISAKEKVDSVSASVKEKTSKVTGLAAAGLNMAEGLIDKVAEKVVK